MSPSWVIFIPLILFLLALLLLGRTDPQRTGADFLKSYFLGDRALKGFVLAMIFYAICGIVAYSRYFDYAGYDAWHRKNACSH